MTRLLTLGTIAAVTLAAGYAARTVVVPWRRTLAFRRFEQARVVDLAGLGTVRLPASFKPVGRGRDGSRDGDFDPETLDQHGDEREITFRFEQGQHRDLGAHFRNPVLLNLTLYNAALPAPDVARVAATTIAPFYPPVDNDAPRLAAHFAAQRWLPDVATGAAVTRATATNDGHGDELMRDGPARWLVIHVDPVRRVRVDLWTWQRAYSLDEARALVRRVAESVEVTPKLATVFAGARTLDARTTARFERTVGDALARLRRCGIGEVTPGAVARQGGCAAWLSASRRDLHVARLVGRAPLAAATRDAGFPPRFRVAPMPPGRPASLVAEPDFQLAMLYWDGAAGRWALEGAATWLGDDELQASPLVPALAAGLTDRARAQLLCLARHDLQFAPERVDLDAFFAECDRVAAALRAGTLLPGVAVTAEPAP